MRALQPINAKTPPAAGPQRVRRRGSFLDRIGLFFCYLLKYWAELNPVYVTPLYVTWIYSHFTPPVSV